MPFDGAEHPQTPTKSELEDLHRQIQVTLRIGVRIREEKPSKDILDNDTAYKLARLKPVVENPAFQSLNTQWHNSIPAAMKVALLERENTAWMTWDPEDLPWMETPTLRQMIGTFNHNEYKAPAVPWNRSDWYEVNGTPKSSCKWIIHREQFHKKAIEDYSRKFTLRQILDNLFPPRTTGRLGGIATPDAQYSNALRLLSFYRTGHLPAEWKTPETAARIAAWEPAIKEPNARNTFFRNLIPWFTELKAARTELSFKTAGFVAIAMAKEI
jgi:hypothetical protein